jgi:hypothetical protein
MRTVSEIIDDCGGPGKIASVAVKPNGKKLTRDAVYKWTDIGIPERYWPLVAKLAGASIEQLFAANIAARRAALKSRKTRVAA